jgi:hypothetical protein
MSGTRSNLTVEHIHLVQPGSVTGPDAVFGRLFPDLPPHDPGGKDPHATLMDTVNRIYDDRPDEVVPVNTGMPAGFTFLSQFVAHDLSHDPSPSRDRRPGGSLAANLRSPRLDLDMVYGGDPDLNPAAYEVNKKKENTYRFRIDQRTGSHKGRKYTVPDLPRKDGRALIPDHRNDNNVVVAQLHLALMQLHNVMMDRVEARHPGRRAAFDEAQQMVRWHYQYAVVEDLLPRFVGRGKGLALLERCRARWRDWQQAMLAPPVPPGVPLEFSVGAYRIGHATLRNTYRVNDEVDPLPLLDPASAGAGRGSNGAPAARPAAARPAPPRNGKPTSLVGRQNLDPLLAVSWDRLLPVAGREKNLQYARAFDHRLASSLKFIPEGPKGGLAELDLERGWKEGLPSGQSVARRLGIPEQQIVKGNHPLWYYTMLEVPQGGRHVGPVAAAILCKVFMDLLHLDPTSYLSRQPSWKPLGLLNSNDAFAYLLRTAGMPFRNEDIFSRNPRP